MKKRLFLCLFYIVISVCICACASNASKDPDTHIVISKDGRVTSNIIESFSESYYDLGELQNMINEEINKYNLNKENAISLKDITLENEIVKVSLEFSSSNDYTAFNDELLFAGSPQEAISKGISLGVILTDKDDNSKTIAESDIKLMVKEKILVTDFKGTIYLPGKVLYYSSNATVFADGKSVKANGSDNAPIYIIYK